MRRSRLFLIFGLAALGLLLLPFVLGGEPRAAALTTAPVERGEIVRQVRATGEIAALVTVEVGTQVSGQLSEIAVDFNSPVTAGQVIARIEPSSFETRVRSAEAELAIARANVAQQRAAVARAKAELANAEAAQTEAARDLERKRALAQRGNMSAAGVDQATAVAEQTRAQVRSAEAGIAVAEAQLQTAQAQVGQREAALETARIDLDRTFIRSPVDGVVLGREVDIGQTVAASFQAPVLFTIAQDLRDMEIAVAVDEADIGQVREGQTASFTVDAFPGRRFEGAVRQVRKAAQKTQNVVTYTVIVSAPNPDQTLLPGMTANVAITVDTRPDVLLIPVAALRWRPESAEGVAPGALSPAGSRPRREARGGGGPASGTVWLAGPEPTPVEVTLGVSDGTVIEVTGGPLAEGQEVVTGARGAGGPQGTPPPAGGGGGRRLRPF